MQLDCFDTNYGAVDQYDGGCEYYIEFPDDCGNFDKEYFKANSMCCACNKSSNF